LKTNGQQIHTQSNTHEENEIYLHEFKLEIIHEISAQPNHNATTATHFRLSIIPVVNIMGRQHIQKKSLSMSFYFVIILWNPYFIYQFQLSS